MPEWLLDLFARYGYAVVFVGVFLENTGLPVPGETTLLAGAALAHFGRLSFGRVIVAAIVAATLGDNLGFAIGRRFGRGLAERHGARTVFIARFITGLRVFCAVLAGGSGLPWPTFIFYNAAGAIVWSIAVAMAGYSLAYSWDTLERWIGRSGLIGLALVVLFVAIGVVRARRNRPS